MSPARPWTAWWLPKGTIRTISQVGIISFIGARSWTPSLCRARSRLSCSASTLSATCGRALGFLRTINREGLHFRWRNSYTQSYILKWLNRVYDRLRLDTEFGALLEAAPKSSNHLPDAGIRNEHQALDRDPGDELAGRLEHQADQLRVFGKEQDAFEQSPPCLRRPYFLEAILRTLGEKIERGYRGREVLSYSGEFARKGGPEGEVASRRSGALSSPRAHVGDFVGQQSDVGRRQTRDGRLPGPRPPAKEEGAAVSHRARGVRQEAAGPREQQSVYDAQNRINRIRIERLANPALAERGVPLSPKIAALDRPPPGV